jgi:hypothetical protein
MNVKLLQTLPIFIKSNFNLGNEPFQLKRLKNLLGKHFDKLLFPVGINLGNSFDNANPIDYSLVLHFLELIK